MKAAIVLLLVLLSPTVLAQQQWVFINKELKARVITSGEQAREWTIEAGTVWPLLRYVRVHPYDHTQLKFGPEEDHAVLRFGSGEFSVKWRSYDGRAADGTLINVARLVVPTEEELGNYNRLVAQYLEVAREDRTNAAPQWMMLRADTRVTVQEDGAKPIDITLPEGAAFPVLRRTRGLDPESLDSYAVLRLGTGEFQIRYADAKQDLGVLWAIDPAPEDLDGYNRLVAAYLRIVEERKTDAARKALQSELKDLEAALADLAQVQEDTTDEVHRQQWKAKRDAEHQRWIQRQRTLNNR